MVEAVLGFVVIIYGPVDGQADFCAERTVVLEHLLARQACEVVAFDLSTVASEVWNLI